MSQPPKSTSSKPPAEPHHKGLLDEDVVHVPKGIPRWQFLTLVALMIVMLIIFIVPPTSLPGMGGDNGERNPVVVRWERPGHGQVEWRESDLLTTMRAMGNALRVDPFLGMQAGVNPQRTERDDFIRLMVLDLLAADAGVRVTDAELAEHIRGSLKFQNASDDDFIRAVRLNGFDQRSIEESMRRILRAVRFTQMLGFAGAVPDPATVEKLWHEEHVEYAFDYAALEVAAMREAALEDLPDDAGLEAWLAALPEAEKDVFKTVERRTAEVIRFRDADTHPAENLLRQFPEVPAEGEEPTPIEDLAQRYYDRVYFTRFRKVEMGAEEVPGQNSWYSREEADRQLVAEAPIYFAMQRWLESLKKRTAEGNGKGIDLLGESTKYGLDHRVLSDVTRDEITELEDIGDAELANQVFGLENDGDFSYNLFATESGICFVRLTSHSEPELPPFAEIREKVIEKWLEPRMGEEALERLERLRADFESFTPEVDEDQQPDPGEHHRATAEDFRAALEGDGLTVEHRAWLDKRGAVTSDPQWELPAHKFIASMAFSRGYYDLAEDEVAEPSLSPDSKTAYLVRLAGQRPVPLENMSPRDYERLKLQSRSTGIYELGNEFDIPFLEQNFGLAIKRAEGEQDAP